MHETKELANNSHMERSSAHINPKNEEKGKLEAKENKEENYTVEDNDAYDGGC